MHTKKFKYYVLMAVAVCAACILGACSSDDEPDRDFDSTFLSDMIDGNASAIIDFEWIPTIYAKTEDGE